MRGYRQNGIKRHQKSGVRRKPQNGIKRRRQNGLTKHRRQNEIKHHKKNNQTNLQSQSPLITQRLMQRRKLHHTRKMVSK